MFRPGTKKTFLVLFVLLLLAGAVFFILRANRHSSLIEKLLPSIHVLGMHVAGISKEELKLFSKVTLENHMPVGFAIDSIAYIVFIDNKQMVRSLYAEPVDLHANGESTIELPVSFEYKKLEELFERLHKIGKDSTRMTINLLLYSSVIPEDSAWVHITQNIPVVVLPAIHFEHLQIGKRTASGARVNVTLLVVNDNTMRFSFRDSKYKVSFENHKALEGTMLQTILLPAKDSVRITIPLDLNFNALGQTLIDYIGKGSHMKYDITVTTRPVTTVSTFKNSDIILHATGELKDFKKVGEKK